MAVQTAHTRGGGDGGTGLNLVVAGFFFLCSAPVRVASFDDLWDQLCGCCCFCERAVFHQAAAAALCCSFHYCALFRQVEPVSETESPVKLQVKIQSKS